MAMDIHWSSQVRFHPWIGEAYGTKEVRWLILGESHYGNLDAACDFTQEVTENYVNGSVQHRFWTVVARTLGGRGLSIQACQQFWQEVAFYNYIQRIVGSSARMRPDAESWQDSAEAFHEVIKQLAPTHMLVLGKTLWQNMPAGASISRENDRAASSGDPLQEIRLYRAGEDGSVSAGWIYHPSSSYFDYQQGQKVVQSLLSGPNELSFA
ncbi:hypothetical protein [Chitinilyticum litopenaei]|uniref:hypothetical protein n=1 Tax=Chitinilyticum litopenaei TaxID=1121276 RepID=UPI000686820F|nr:hypothetical protein [Chitinilyticum litopenaei]